MADNRPTAKLDSHGASVHLTVPMRNADAYPIWVSKADAMALACELIEAATGYRAVVDEGEEPERYLRPLSHERYAELRLKSVDPAVMGPPTRYKHQGCGGGLVVRASDAGADCRRCGAALSHEEAKRHREAAGA